MKHTIEFYSITDLENKLNTLKIGTQEIYKNAKRLCDALQIHNGIAEDGMFYAGYHGEIDLSSNPRLNNLINEIGIDKAIAQHGLSYDQYLIAKIIMDGSDKSISDLYKKLKITSVVE